MFFPKFAISNKLLNSLVKVELNLNTIKNLDVLSEWKVRLQKETKIRAIICCLRLMGLEVSSDVIQRVVLDEPGRDETALEVAQRLEVVVKEKEMQLVLNIINAYRLTDQLVYLATKFRQETIGEKELVQINKMLGEKIVSVDSLGQWRGDLVANLESSIVHPKPHEILYQLEDLFLWCKTADRKTVHPIIMGMITFCELVRIWPLANNNFVTCLLFITMLMGTNGYDMSYLVFEDEIHKFRQQLAEKLSIYTSTNGGDLSGVVEELVELLAMASEKSKLRVVSIVGESAKYKMESGRAVALSERQVVLMEELTSKGQLSIKELRQVLPMVSDDTILRDLKDLVAKKMVRKRGKTKGALYALAQLKRYG